jgi:PPOX class probable F420-dependent enzyme
MKQALSIFWPETFFQIGATIPDIHKRMNIELEENRDDSMLYIIGKPFFGVFVISGRVMRDERVKNTMPFQLPDQTTPFGQRVARRLQEEPIIWLTTIDSKGTPQPAPVWFWWDDQNQNILIYSKADAKREAHLRNNPRVSLHFNSNQQGGDIIVLTGKAEFSNDPPAFQHQLYVAKYSERIKNSFGTPENFAERYPVPLRIQPLSIRGF